MSSACVCHIEGEWCFYCEMYLPLERKAEELERTAIDIIEDLLFSYINKDDGFPHHFEIKAFEKALEFIGDFQTKYRTDLFTGYLKTMKEATE